MNRAIERASRRWIGICFSTRAWRELAIGISRGFLQKKHAFDYDEEDEDSDRDVDEDNPEEIHDIQAGHTSWIAGNIYSRGIMEMSGVIASMRERFDHASLEWHQF